MTLYKKAQALAVKGFHVFPLISNDKKPAIDEFTEKATDDPDNLKKFWYDSVLEIEQPFNIGIATTNFKDHSLLVVDVDNKEGRNGSGSIIALELKGFVFPKTLTQKTPSGGFHYIYSTPEPVGQSANLFIKELGLDEKTGKSGIDTRARGGYIVGAGSSVGGKEYSIDSHSITPAPQWLITYCSKTAHIEKRDVKETNKISQKGAVSRAIDYLQNQAPVAVHGSANNTTYIVASRVKDYGVNEANALQIMFDNWNENCQPPGAYDDLKTVIHNAYSYGQNAQGADSPESDFKAIEKSEDGGEEKLKDPVQALNDRFAFIVLGGKSTIIHKSNDGQNEFMGVQAFHDLLAADTIQTGNGRRQQLSELWFKSHKRATYTRAQLLPEEKAPPGVYNLWRGFSVKTLKDDETPTADMIEGARMFKEHALENVCYGDDELYQWLMGYFAHLIQKPNEKPLVALVFKGQKGVGKNALIDRIGAMFSGHYLLTSNRRYVLSNFNKHLANLILFVLDEAFWSGDKQAEGILKDLITGNTHLIEHKGREMFSTRNVLRLVIIGNEQWVVPASEDERRYAVFNVGNKRRRDKSFFIKMKNLLESKGGNRLLMRDLKQFDLSSVDVDEAPDTIGLLEQKVESLNPIHSWWLGSLKEGVILNLDFAGDEWLRTVGRDQLRSAFLNFAKGRGIRSWLPDAASFGRTLLKASPDIESKRPRGGESRQRAYMIPDLDTCRAHFSTFIGHKMAWEEDEEPSNVIDATKMFS